MYFIPSILCRLLFKISMEIYRWLAKGIIDHFNLAKLEAKVQSKTRSFKKGFLCRKTGRIVFIFVSPGFTKIYFCHRKDLQLKRVSFVELVSYTGNFDNVYARSEDHIFFNRIIQSTHQR